MLKCFTIKVIDDPLSIGVCPCKCKRLAKRWTTINLCSVPFFNITAEKNYSPPQRNNPRLSRGERCNDVSPPFDGVPSRRPQRRSRGRRDSGRWVGAATSWEPQAVDTMYDRRRGLVTTSCVRHQSGDTALVDNYREVSGSSWPGAYQPVETDTREKNAPGSVGTFLITEKSPDRREPHSAASLDPCRLKRGEFLLSPPKG